MSEASSSGAAHSDAITSWVELGGGARAFLATPGDGSPPFAAVVLGQEPDGALRDALDLAERLARNGYMAIAPDLTPPPDAAGAGSNGSGAGSLMSDDAARGALSRALDYLLTRPEVDAGCIVALGAGRSAGYPYRLSSIRHEIAANILLYGGAASADEVVETLTAPTLGIFGEADPAVPLRDVAALRSRLEQHRKSYELHLFPGPSQGWLGGEDAVEAPWAAVLDFLGRLRAGDYPPSRVRWRWLPH